LFLFGCGGYNDDFSKGLAIYDKDFNIVNTFETKDAVYFMIAIDKNHLLLG
jgi:hypothetical protein